MEKSAKGRVIRSFFDLREHKATLIDEISRKDYVMAEILARSAPPGYITSKHVKIVIENDLDTLLEILIDGGKIKGSPIKFLKHAIGHGARKCAKLLVWRFKDAIALIRDVSVIQNLLRKVASKMWICTTELLITHQTCMNSVEHLGNAKYAIYNLFAIRIEFQHKNLIRILLSRGLLDVNEYFECYGCYASGNIIEMDMIMEYLYLYRPKDRREITKDEAKIFEWFLDFSHLCDEDSNTSIRAKTLKYAATLHPRINYYSFIQKKVGYNYDPYVLVMLAVATGNIDSSFYFANISKFLKVLSRNLHRYDKHYVFAELKAFFELLKEKEYFDVNREFKQILESYFFIGDYGLVLLYIRGGADYTARNDFGETILHRCASRIRHIESTEPDRLNMLNINKITQYILSDGKLDMNVKDNRKRTAIDILTEDRGTISMLAQLYNYYYK